MRSVKTLLVSLALVSKVACGQAAAADWPMYGRDAARSGVTSEQLKVPLHLQWVYVPRHGPQRAWPEPSHEPNRLTFDHAFQVAAALGMVYFGSSADNKVYALDAATGRERWSFFTEGPVRFAPAVWQDRVFAASDDGWLYCLSAAEGKLLWKFRGGPRNDRLLGNGRMMSRWPLRGGVMVDDGTVYLAAGMWPAEGVYVYALRTEDGAVIWKNDASGSMFRVGPHGGETMSGVAPQGYLLAAKDILFVPTGRSMPAAFDRKTGRFLYYRVIENGQSGGAWASITGDLLFCWSSPGQPGFGVRAWDCKTGYCNSKFLLTGAQRVVVGGDSLYAQGSGRLSAFDLGTFVGRPEPTAAEVKRSPWLAGYKPPPDQTETSNLPADTIPSEAFRRASWYESYGFLDRAPPKPGEGAKWQAPCDRGAALILAGETLFAGGLNKVVAVNAAKGEVVWTGAVNGQVHGLAVAGGRLFVSTHTGEISCFGSGEAGKPVVVRPGIETAPFGQESQAALAERIVKETAVTQGYCLLLGAGDGRLAFELAKRTALKIHCLEPDAVKLAATRKALNARGLYGARVTVDHGSTDKLPYPPYFADLVVLGDSQADLGASLARELYRVLRPYGGVIWTTAAGPAAKGLHSRLRAAGVPPEEIRNSELGTLIVRGPLSGAGDWTHQNADAGRSGCSADRLVKWPLEMLWFGEPGPAGITNRGSEATPLCMNGRLFVGGRERILALDAYNGRQLWVRGIPGLARPVPTNTSSLVADADSVYVAAKDTCLRLAAKTGKPTQTYALPSPNPVPQGESERGPAQPGPRPWWGYLARWGELLVGSVAVGDRKWFTQGPSESREVFALERQSGRLRWRYRAQGKVPNTMIAISDGRVFLVDRVDTKAAKPSSLVALDANSGQELWKTSAKLSGQDLLLAAEGVVLATGDPLSGQSFGRTGVGGKMVAYDAKDGRFLWSRQVPVDRAPVIVGGTVYAQLFAYDLRTGASRIRRHPLTDEELPWRFRKSHGCTMLSACPSMLFFRSGTAGMYDLAADRGVLDYGGIRTSCAINMIPAAGLVLIPEGSSGCTCSLNFQTSLALVPGKVKEEDWSVSTEFGGTGPVRRLALNLGAPGDRRDEEGNLWLAFPRPPTGRALKVEAAAKVLPGLGYFRRGAEGLAQEGCPRPWLYASGCRGMSSLSLQVDLSPRVAAPLCAQPPKIDGQLGDPCWDGQAPLVFRDNNTENSPSPAVAFLRHDQNHLYFAFQRDAGAIGSYKMAWTAKTSGHDAPVWLDDSWELFLSDAGRTVCLRLGVSASGARYDSLFRYGQDRREDAKWNGKWTSAVSQSKERWILEVAVPWQTLADAGLSKDRLTINLKGTGGVIWHTDYCQVLSLTSPGLQDWNPPERFVPVALGAAPGAPQRAYTVRLHFAESDDVKPGQRVFDVKIQGATVLKNLDILKEAGGRNKAVVREYKDIMASDTVKLDLFPRSRHAEITPFTAPVLNGVEVVVQQKGG